MYTLLTDKKNNNNEKTPYTESCETLMHGLVFLHLYSTTKLILSASFHSLHVL